MRRCIMKKNSILSVLVLAVFLAAPLNVSAPRAEEQVPLYLRDRGTGVPTSMFGTYIRKGEFIFYPFFEYYINSDEEYAPSDLGFQGDTDYRGEYTANEGLVFLGYGLTEDLAFELEAGVIDATLKSSPEDSSNVPDEISESGLNEVESRISWRFLRETEKIPEAFSYFHLVFPIQDNKRIIGTSDWDFDLGAGVTKGFSWGTATLRAAITYEGEESKLGFGEYALEYLKRLSDSWRIYAALEGTEDEIEFIPELQWHLRPNMIIKLNSAFGLTSKAQDWAPEAGIMFYF
jgi:hypothetical protein